MKLALLKGNRFNPWHLRVFNHMPTIEPVAFRAESEVQQRMAAHDDGSAPMPVEPVQFHAAGQSLVSRITQTLRPAGLTRERILPFHDRLEGFDAILTWELFTDWTLEALEARRKFHTPVAVVVWDNIPFNQEDDATAKAIKARAIGEADLFIVHTERSRRALLIEGIDPERVRIIPHGVDTEAFTPGPDERRGFGFSPADFVILFVGWLLPRKGIDFLLLALHQLRADPDLADIAFKLHAVGSGPGTERVETLIERLRLQEDVRFTEGLPYNEMVRAYRSADVFVLPSIATETWQEQFGMALMEAMSTGLPCVSTRSGSIPEILGESGVLCQPNDFLSLYEAIKELALDSARRTSLGESARARTLKHFTLKAHSAGLESALHELKRLRA